MANSIDNRIVNMVFNNAKFQQGVTQTMASLGQLDASIRKLDTSAGFINLQKSLDRLNFAKMGANAEAAKGKLDFSEANKSLGDLEARTSRFSFGKLLQGLAGLKGRLTFGRDAAQEFDQAEQASRRVSFRGILTAVSNVRQRLGQMGQGADQSINNINQSASRINLAPVAQATQQVGQQFSAMQAIAFGAFTSIGAAATAKGAEVAKSLTLGPISAGFHEYSTNLKSIQTILANTQADGTNLRDVNAALEELNEYSDKTIYNFGEMAKNIGTFTAAGVNLETSVQSIKGIANLAALSGSNSQQASTAMYQLSQAIAAGKVNLMDWNSVVNAGMGGKVFQTALFNTGKAMGTITNSPVGQTFEQWEKAGNSFRLSLSETMKAADTGEEKLAKAQIDAAKTVADAQESAAESIESAQERVADAQLGVAEAAKAGSEDVKDAVADQRETIERSAQNVKDAFQQMVDARKALKEAMKPPSKDELEAASDALKTAQLDQADLSDAVTEAQDKQRRASEQLAQAEGDLSKAYMGGNPAEIKEAQDALQDAKTAVKDLADEQIRAAISQRDAARGVTEAEKELQETRKKGTKADKNVKNAQDALAQATKQYRDTQIQAREDVADAELRVAEVTRQAAKRRQEAGEQLAEAEEAQAKTIIKANESVAAAQESAAESIENTKKEIVSSGPDMGWLTSKVLTSTLKQFTGDLSDAELAAQGFTKAQIKAIQAQAKTATKAATEVKTLGALYDVTKEQIGTGWADTFKLLFGDFGEAKTLFTGLSKEIGAIVGKNAEARNSVLKEWKNLGGRDDLIQGFRNIVGGLNSVLEPIKDAWRDIFPAKSGSQLADLTSKFADLTEKLRLSPETADKVRRAFAGLFALIDIRNRVVIELFKSIGDLFQRFSGGKLDILELVASLGDWFVSVDMAIRKGEGLSRFFDGLEDVIAHPIQAIKDFATALHDLFTGESDGGKLADEFERIRTGSGPLSEALGAISSAWRGVATAMQRVGDVIGPIFDKIVDIVSSIGDRIAEAMEGITFDNVANVLQVGLLAVIAKTVRNAFGNGLINFADMMEPLNEVFGQMTKTLTIMQTNLKSEILLKIAVALGLLAASVTALSKIDADDLGKAMTAMAVGFGQLVGAMTLMMKMGGGLKPQVFLTMALSMVPLSASMIMLAAAIDVLTIAVVVLSRLSWEELAKGLVGVGGALVAVGKGLTYFPVPKTMLAIGAAMIPLAIGLNILALAMLAMSRLSWEDLAKGMVGLGGALAAVGRGLLFIPAKTLIPMAAGLTILAVALNGIALAVAAFGAQDTVKMAQGLAGIGLSLIAIGRGLLFIPTKGLIPMAAGLVLVSVALNGIAVAVGLMGQMDIATLAKGLASMGIGLRILSKGVKPFVGLAPAGGALIAVAIGLNLMVPALALMGSLDLLTIAKGLAAMAGVIATVGKVGAFAAPGIQLLGMALLPFAAAALIAGVAALALGKGLQLMGKEGSKGVAVMLAAMTGFVALLPKMMVDFAKGLVGLVGAIAELTPQLVESFNKIITGLLQIVIDGAPKMAEAARALVRAFLDVLVGVSVEIVAAGLRLLMDLLRGIRDNIYEITIVVSDIIINFLNALAEKMPAIIDAGVNLTKAFIKGVILQIAEINKPAADAINNFLETIAGRLDEVVNKGIELIKKFVRGVASKVSEMSTTAGKAVSNFISGITGKISDIYNAGKRIITNVIEGITSKIREVLDRGKQIGTSIYNGLRNAVNDIKQAANDIGTAIREGVEDGVRGLGGLLKSIILAPFDRLPGFIKRRLGIKSPSRVFMEIGANIVAGSVKGINSGVPDLMKSGENMATSVVDSMRNSIGKVPNVLDGLVETEPTITPILDLSQVSQEAKKLGDMTNVVPITAAASFNNATAISAEKASNDEAAAEAAQGEPAPIIQLTQNNTSPKALSEAEIYRNTNNQLSQVKSVLAKKAG